jgi:hypothetical protein
MKPLSSFYRSHDSNFISQKNETLQSFISHFHKNLQATAIRKQSGFYEEISQMFGGQKQKYNSVQAAVDDMITRTGLQSYLQNISAQQKQNKKTAQDQNLFPTAKPNVRENIFHFIRNKVSDAHGRIPIAVLQDEILSTFRNDGIQPEDIYSEALARYINQVIIAEQIKNPIHESSDPNLGKNLQEMDDDGSNDDFFRGLNPS